MTNIVWTRARIAARQGCSSSQTTKGTRAAVVAALAAALIAAATASGEAAASPGWLLKCAYTHSLADDPIVYPGRAGAAHLHDFFGNKSVNAASSYASMTAASSTCRDARDTAGYWAPALYEDGVKITPSGVSYKGVTVREQLYYRKIGSGPVRAFPPDFRMVAGDPHGMTMPYKLSEIYWGCSDNSTGKLALPPQCRTGIISLHVGFPSCWNGWQLDSPDHQSHVTYPKSGVCPSTHRVAIPRLLERFEYPVGPTTGMITLSSGSTYSVHADFWNTWNQSRLEQLTADCLNKNVDCGTLG